MTEADKNYMALALELAERGAGWTSPNPMVGAVIVKDGAIIGQGYHARCGDLHAERAALKNCTGDPAGGTLYVTLEPCPMCAGAILNARLSRVVYGASDPKAGCMGSVCDLTAMPFPTVPYYKSGVLEAECREVLDQFFRELRKKGE